MKIAELIAKMLAGKELSAEEKAFLAAYQEPEVSKAEDDKDKGQMIPKSRLDQEIAKRKAAEKEAEEAKAKAEELESKDLTEQEKLTKAQEKLAADLAKATKERDEAIAARGDLEFKSKVAELSGKHNFTDPEYLGFLAKKQGIDLNDETATKGLIESLKKDSPKFFKVDTTPGGGTPPVNQEVAGAARIKELLGKKDLTMQEVSEIAKLEAEQKAAESSKTPGAANV